jgi:hypothetical protein
VHCLAWHPSAPGRAYEAGGDGAAWSRDAGRSWDRADAGRDRRYAWALAVDVADPERWYVSAAPGPFQAHGSGSSDSAMYRWEGAGPWQMIEGPRDSHVYALAAGHDRLFAGLGDGTLLQSQDGGESWAKTGRADRRDHGAGREVRDRSRRQGEGSWRNHRPQLSPVAQTSTRLRPARLLSRTDTATT